MLGAYHIQKLNGVGYATAWPNTFGQADTDDTEFVIPFSSAGLFQSFNSYSICQFALSRHQAPFADTPMKTPPLSQI
jgi:hypothetical protein